MGATDGFSPLDSSLSVYCSILFYAIIYTDVPYIGYITFYDKKKNITILSALNFISYLKPLYATSHCMT